MGTAGPELDQIYFEMLFVPGVLSFALVIALVIARRLFLVISRRMAVASFSIGLLIISSTLPAWRVLFPEPCLYFLSKPLAPCFIGSTAAFEMGIFAGLVGGLAALFTLKASQLAVRKDR